MADQQPKNILKYLAIAVGGLLLIIIIKGALSPSKPPKDSHNTKTPLQAAADNASPDTSNETLKALSAQIQQVSDQDKKIIARDNQEQKANHQMILGEQQQIQTSLQKAQQQYSQNNNEQTKTVSKYPIGGNSAGTSGGGHLVWKDDMQTTLSNAVSGTNPQFAAIKNGNAFTNNYSFPSTIKKAADKPIPRYTIPANSVLADTSTMTGLIGRIPINGIVHDPYTFLLIAGANNLAANETTMPDVAKVMISGTATGDMELSCVRGTITSLTFIFTDGRIWTVPGSGKKADNVPLGYLASDNGNPCISGIFHTNAPEYLGITMGLGAGQGAANAYSAAQTTSTANVIGGATTSVTGSPGAYVGGQALAGGAGAAQHWWDERQQNSFDAVYVSPIDPATGLLRQIAIIVTQEIPINYDPSGRKVAYENPQSNPVNHALD